MTPVLEIALVAPAPDTPTVTIDMPGVHERFEAPWQAWTHGGYRPMATARLDDLKDADAITRTRIHGCTYVVTWDGPTLKLMGDPSEVAASSIRGCAVVNATNDADAAATARLTLHRTLLER